MKPMTPSGGVCDAGRNLIWKQPVTPSPHGWWQSAPQQRRILTEDGLKTGGKCLTPGRMVLSSPPKPLGTSGTSHLRKSKLQKRKRTTVYQLSCSHLEAGDTPRARLASWQTHYSIHQVALAIMTTFRKPGVLGTEPTNITTPTSTAKAPVLPSVRNTT